MLRVEVDVGADAAFSMVSDGRTDAGEEAVTIDGGTTLGAAHVTEAGFSVTWEC